MICDKTFMPFRAYHYLKRALIKRDQVMYSKLSVSKVLQMSYQFCGFPRQVNLIKCCEEQKPDWFSHNKIYSHDILWAFTDNRLQLIN